MDKSIHIFRNLQESFTSLSKSEEVLDLDLLSYKLSNQYKNMIAIPEYCGYNIFNPEIVLKLSHKVRLKDVRHVYSTSSLIMLLMIS